MNAFAKFFSHVTFLIILSGVFSVRAYVLPPTSTGVTLIKTPDFQPQIPSSASGDVDYEFTFACYASGDANCGMGASGGVWDNSGELDSKTEQYGTVGGVITVYNGVAEKTGLYKSGDCDGHLWVTWTHFYQAMNGLTSPATYTPNGDGGYFYDHMPKDPACPTTNTTFTGAHWSVIWTHPSSLPCAFGFNACLQTCNGVPYNEPVASWFSAYIKVTIHIDQGYSLPSLSSLGIPLSPVGSAFVGDAPTGGGNKPPFLPNGFPLSGTEIYLDTQATTADVPIALSSVDVEGSIAGISLYEGTTFLGTATNTSGHRYDFTWNSVSNGSHFITVVATDDVGASITNSPILISVGTATTNIAPYANIFAPVNGGTYPASVDFIINAADIDGSVTNVAVFKGANMLGTATNVGSIYSFTWNASAPATNIFAIVVTDNEGASVTNTVTINQLPPPTVDESFVPYTDGAIKDVAVQTNGEVLICGDFSNVNFTTRTKVAKLNNDGSLDTTFDPSAAVATNLTDALCIAVDSVHRVYVGGDYFDGSDYYSSLIRLDYDGNIDKLAYGSDNFTYGGGYGECFYAMSGYGQEISIPHVTFASPYKDVFVRQGVFYVVRTNDTMTNLPSWAFSTANMYVGGSFSEINGQTANKAATITIGSSSDGGIYGIQPDYSYFPAIMGNTVYALVWRTSPYDMLTVAGDVYGYDAGDNGILDGIWDGDFFNFTFSGGVDGIASALVLQPDGKYLIGGSFTTLAGSSVSDFGRFNSDGTSDTNFNANVTNTITSGVSCLLRQSNGKILVADGNGKIWRFNSDGTVDTGFSASCNGSIAKLVQQPDGKIIAVGEFSTFGGFSCANIVRFIP